MYKNGVVIFPNNAEIIDGKYTLKPKDPGLPDDQVSDSLGLSILALQIGVSSALIWRCSFKKKTNRRIKPLMSILSFFIFI